LFPLHGGTGNIWKQLFMKLPKEKFQFQIKVETIDVNKKFIKFDNGIEEAFDCIVSTMPLDQLIGKIKGWNIPEEEIKQAQAKFRYSSTHIIGIGLNGQVNPDLKTKCWMYFAEENAPFYRCTVFSNYSKYHCPKPDEQWSLMCEVSESPCKQVPDQDTLIQLTIDGLVNTGLLTPEQAQCSIVSKFYTRLEYGYPTPFIGRDELVERFHTELEKFQIYSRGRFGTWKYEVSNQDHSFMQGVEVIDRILFDATEMTKSHPSIVNQYSAENQKIKRTPLV
jgi:protoporphyrinogen oxidase